MTISNILIGQNSIQTLALKPYHNKDDEAIEEWLIMLKTEAYDRKQRLQKRVLAYQDSLPLERRSPFIIAAEKEAIKDHEKFKVYH